MNRRADDKVLPTETPEHGSFQWPNTPGQSLEAFLLSPVPFLLSSSLLSIPVGLQRLCAPYPHYGHGPAPEMRYSDDLAGNSCLSGPGDTGDSDDPLLEEAGAVPQDARGFQKLMPGAITPRP